MTPTNPTTSPMDDLALLPCPFCNSRACTSQAGDVWFIHCQDTDCYASNSDFFRSEPKAIAAWNARSPIAPSREEEKNPFEGTTFETRSERAARISREEEVERVAVNQNDKMRQELAHIGNLVSDLARAMRVDQANADGTWPDLPGRIRKLTEAALASIPPGSDPTTETK